MSSSNLPDWENIFKKVYCSDCGQDITFDGECSECKEPWSVNEWGT